MLTTHEVADRLGINARSVARLIQQGRLVATKRGRDWFIEEIEVERFAKARKPAGRPKGATKR